MLYELTGVTKRYTQGRKTVDALAGVDLQIADGEFLVIQGSTGSGKTTLLQMLGALDRPTQRHRWSTRAATWPSWGRATWRSSGATPTASSSSRSTSSPR